MKQSISYIFIALAACCALSCYKDLGNYKYKVPSAPVVQGLDSVYHATLGDTLVVAPTVTIAGSSQRLGFQWRIDVPAHAGRGVALRAGDEIYLGQVRLQFELGSGG